MTQYKVDFGLGFVGPKHVLHDTPSLLPSFKFIPEWIPYPCVETLKLLPYFASIELMCVNQIA